MKNTIQTRGGEMLYSAPAIEITEIAVEQGFAASGGSSVPGFGEPSEASWNPYGMEDIYTMERY